MVAAAVVGGGAALGGAYLASNSAGDAASAQTDANNAAIDRSAATNATNTAALNQQQQQAQANLQPYLNTGTAANSQLSYDLGLGGADQSGGAQAAGGLAKPFTLADFQADPGYNFTLQQGDAALNRASAAGGKYFSGAAIKGLDQYNQGLASTQYQNAYNNYNTNQNNLYSKLSGTSLSGQNAANSINSNGLATQQSIAGESANATNNQNALQSQNGTTQANADLAQGQAWQTGLNNVSNLAGFGSGFQQGFGGTNSGYGTQGTTVGGNGTPWLTSNV